MNDLKSVSLEDLKNLYIAPPDSHKGQNGKLLIIGGSHLFHAASLWALQVASRIVDMVHYCSVEENNDLVMRLKSEFRNGIVVKRENVEEYIREDDCILIGPGMVRPGGAENSTRQMADKFQIPNNYQIQNLNELDNITDEGVYTKLLTNYLLQKYPQKQWVIDAGALQTVDPGSIPPNSILTPHKGEFEKLLYNFQFSISNFQSKLNNEKLNLQNFNQTELTNHVRNAAEKLKCIVLLKGQMDIACSANECRIIEGGNAGMTKGGTGDVLAGFVAALACKNNPFLATIAGSYINKKAGDQLYRRVGVYFNASDLASEIPVALSHIIPLETG